MTIITIMKFTLNTFVEFLSHYARHILALFRNIPAEASTRQDFGRRQRQAVSDTHPNDEVGAISSTESRVGQPTRSKPFRKADEAWIIAVTGIRRSSVPWDEDMGVPLVKPSGDFAVRLDGHIQLFVLSNEAGCRVIIDVFLYDILNRAEFQGKVKVYPEARLSATGAQRKSINGVADYTVGYQDAIKSTPEPSSIAIEAKYRIKDSNIPQCLAEAASLYKMRRRQRYRDCTVWGVLTDCRYWIFIRISHSGSVTQSPKYEIPLTSYNGEQIERVYRVLYHMATWALNNNSRLPPSHSYSDSSDEA
jgi:hypothetical protein